MLIIKSSLKEEIVGQFSKEIIGHFKNNMYFRIHDKEISYYTSRFYRHI